MSNKPLDYHHLEAQSKTLRVHVAQGQTHVAAEGLIPRPPGGAVQTAGAGSTYSGVRLALSVKETAEILGVSEKTLFRWGVSSSPKATMR